MVAVAFLVTMAMVPASKRIATLVGAIDYPSNRRVNTEPIPRCGGIAIYMGIIAAAFTLFIGIRFFDWEMIDFYRIEEIDYRLLFIGVTVMFAVGLIDDITQLKAGTKFIGQVIAVAIVVMAGVSIGTIRTAIAGDYIELGWLDYPLSGLYLLVFINVINLIDGLDGLASGVVAIVSAGLFYLVFIRGSMILSIVCLVLIAVCIAFLCFNFYPASIFMGDSGAMLLGMVVGIISIVGVMRTQSFVIMVVPIAIAGVPVVDTMSAIVRRIRGHESIGHADLEHVHHRLMRLGLGQLRSVAVLWACTAIFTIAGCAISVLSGPMRMAVFIVLFIVVFVAIWRFGLFGSVVLHHYDNIGKTGPRLPDEDGK